MRQMTGAPSGFRTIPQNAQAEASLLGAIMVNNEAYHRVQSFLRADDFYEPVHRRLFDAMRIKIDAGGLADHVTLLDAFQHDADLAGINGPEFLANMMRSAETVAVSIADDYGRLISNLALRRRHIAGLEHALNRAYDPEYGDAPATMISDHAADLELIREGARDGDAIAVMDWASLASQTPPERVSLVGDGWLPAGYVTALYGPGAAGKSLLTQQLATAVSLGLPWLGMETVKTRTLALYCEEDDVELWRRQIAICKDLGCRMEDLAGRFLAQGRNGLESRLVSPGRDGLFTTSFFAHLVRYIKSRNIGLVIIDNRSNVFDGDENSRAQASYTINRFAAITKATDCTCLLVGHTAKTEGSEYSGNAGWNDHIRCRWSFRLTDPERGIRTLQRPKSNYGAPNAEIMARWHEGALRLHLGEDAAEVRALVAQARQPIKDGLEQLAVLKIATSSHPQSRTFLPKVLHSKSLCLDHKQRILERAIDEMIRDGTLLIDQRLWRDRHRKWVLGLATIRMTSEEEPTLFGAGEFE